MKKILSFFSLLVLALALVACDPPKEEDPKVETKLVIGSVTEAGVNFFGTFWGNNGTNADARRLTFGYETVVYKREEAKYEVDEMVVKNLETTANADGSKTYTITLQEDLVWNNGVKVTAKDYVFAMMLGINPLFGKAMGLSQSTTGRIVGSRDYVDATKNADGLAELEGVDLLGEFKFSVTIGAEHFPYYYEHSYYQVTPYPAHHLIPNGDVVQGTTGAKLTGITEQGFKDTIDDGSKGYRYDIAVTCGPYTLTDFNTSDSTVTLKINPLFKGNYEGQKPNIDYVVIRYVTNALLLTQLETGEIDLITQLGGAQVLEGLLAVGQSRGKLNFTAFARNGYGLIGFNCDEPAGPGSSAKVRQAIAYLLNRDLFAETFTRGFGVLPHGQYGLAQWMVAAATNEDGVVMGRDKAGALVPLNEYSYDPAKAIELLEAEGYVFDENGQPYVQGTDTVRYKKVGDNYVALVIPWGNTANNPVSDLIRSQLLPNARAVGMRITDTTMDFNTMLWRDYYGANGDGYGVPQKVDGVWQIPAYNAENDLRETHMQNLATGFTTGIFEPYYSVSIEYWGWDGGSNINYIYDEEMLEAAEKMMKASNDEEYLRAWQQYQLRYNYNLPNLPLYSDLFHSFFNSKLRGYVVTAEWIWPWAVLYATMDE